MDIAALSAVFGAVILAGLTLFQLALIAGAPIGRFAWGGRHTVLPSKLRFASGLSIVLYGLFAVVLLSKAGVVDMLETGIPLSIGIWIIFAYFTLGIVMNAISRSKPERFIMTPIAVCLAVVFFVVASAS